MDPLQPFTIIKIKATKSKIKIDEFLANHTQENQ